MKRGLKKKGSSLVAVLVICSIILVTASTMIGVATADVRMRINQSKKLENMYKSDSGIEVVQNILAKDSTIAIEKAKLKAQEVVAPNGALGGAVGERSDSELYDEINKEFKIEFIHYLIDSIGENNINTSSTIDITSDSNHFNNNTQKIGELANGLYDSRLIYSILSGSYISESNASSTTFENAFKNITKPEITIESAKYDGSEKKISLVINSKFEDKSAKDSSKKVSNKKEIQVKFEIVAPEYSEIINRNNELGTETISSPYSNLIAADGNLYINSTTEASGDMWVQGNAKTAIAKNPGYAFSKYNGGVIIANGKNLTTSTYEIGEQTKNSNIYTANTFTMTNNSTVDLAGNIYSGNTYIGPTKVGDDLSSNKSTLTLKDMTTYNDLAVNSLGSEIKMDNYYGVNYGTNENEEKTRKSSCILINNYNSDSKLTIKNNAYIMGVAYIATGKNDGNEAEAYQTGESVAVKGNYKVYQEVLPGYEDKVTLKYYDPVQLVYSIDGDTSVAKKKDYFNKYYKEKKLGDYKKGGVSIGTIYSTGAYVSNNNTTEGKVETAKTKVSDKQNEYAQKVFAMNTNVSAPYSEGKVKVTVAGEGNIIKFNDIEESVVSKSEVAVKNGDSSYDAWRYVLSKNPDETVVIGKNKISIVTRDSNNVENTIAEFANKNAGNVEAVIIAKGNVELESGVNFTGTILTGGDVTVKEGNETTKITYDAQLVAQIINSNKLSKYIDTTNAIPVGTVTVNTGDKISIDSSESNGYNVLDVVKKGLWKQIK